MAIQTQTTVLQKTVTAASVKLTTPADRIGQGLAGMRLNPANVPSAYPTSERMSGPRSELAMSPVESPAVRVGVIHVPGSSASLHGSLRHALPASGWRLASKPGARGADFPGCVRSRHRFEGDCQSPDRLDDATRSSKRKVVAATTAKK